VRYYLDRVQKTIELCDELDVVGRTRWRALLVCASVYMCASVCVCVCVCMRACIRPPAKLLGPMRMVPRYTGV
jgi:hypothetical protein